MKLSKVIVDLKSTKEVENFLKDILTPNEIAVIEERWAIAKLLYKKELKTAVLIALILIFQTLLQNPPQVFLF